jgi:hypothetical protein
MNPFLQNGKHFKYHQSRVFYLKYLFVKFDQIKYSSGTNAQEILKGTYILVLRKLFYGKP